MTQFYAITNRIKIPSHSTCSVTDKATACGKKTGAFLAETAAIAPRLIIGFDRFRGNTASLSPSAGAWGMLNGTVGYAARGLGCVVGLLGSVVTSPIGLALGYGFSTWTSGGTKLGIAIGATLAKVPVGVSELARAVCGSLVCLAGGVIAELFGQAGGAIGTLADFAITPKQTVNNLSEAW